MEYSRKQNYIDSNYPPIFNFFADSLDSGTGFICFSVINSLINRYHDFYIHSKNKF